MQTLVNLNILRQTTFLLIVFTIGIASSCSSAPAPDNPLYQKKYIDICVDGKVVQITTDKTKVPVSNIMVNLYNANGKQIKSVRTKEFGRFLIDTQSVMVGYDDNKYIHIEIIDDAQRDGYSEETKFESEFIRKSITAAPNGKAILSMDDIIMKKALK